MAVLVLFMQQQQNKERENATRAHCLILGEIQSSETTKIFKIMVKWVEKVNLGNKQLSF